MAVSAEGAMMWRIKTLAAAVTASSILLAGTAWFAHSSGKRSGMSEIQSRWDAEVAAMAIAQAAEITAARERESALNEQLARQRRDHRNEVNRLAAQHAAAIDGLRNRPDRPSDGGLPEGASAGAGYPGGCTGAELYRPDAEFLIGLAGEADRLRLALAACIAHTSEIERQLNPQIR